MKYSSSRQIELAARIFLFSRAIEWGLFVKCRLTNSDECAKRPVLRPPVLNQLEFVFREFRNRESCLDRMLSERLQSIQGQCFIAESTDSCPLRMSFAVGHPSVHLSCRGLGISRDTDRVRAPRRRVLHPCVRACVLEYESMNVFLLHE